MGRPTGMDCLRQVLRTHAARGPFRSPSSLHEPARVLSVAAIAGPLPLPGAAGQNGATDGNRTRDTQIHNLVL